MARENKNCGTNPRFISTPFVEAQATKKNFSV